VREGGEKDKRRKRGKRGRRGKRESVQKSTGWVLIVYIDSSQYATNIIHQADG